MRAIKFRAWDTEKKEMIYDGMCDKCDGWYGSENTYLHIHFDGSISGQISDDGGKNGLHEHDADIKKDRLILMQFTGLLDRHNIPIYEGDIVRVSNPSSQVQSAVLKCTIVYSYCSFAFQITEVEEWKHYNVEPPEIDSIIYFPYTIYKHLEVIGNIWESAQ